MNYRKIEHNELLNAVGTEYALDKACVKQIRRGNAVIALSNMHNKKLITNTMAENKGYEVEPTQDDIDMLNGD